MRFPSDNDTRKQHRRDRTVFLNAQLHGALQLLELGTQGHSTALEALGTGLDLVQMQIEVAEGRPLSVTQEDIKGNGYAIECRLYAEDAANDFMPATGKILKWSTPSVTGKAGELASSVDGLRIETGVENGSVISTHYDPMIAKLITHGKDRTEAQRKMSAALANLNCLGLTTNQDFLKAILANDDFQAGKYDTHFLKKQFNYKKEQSQQAIELAALAVAVPGTNPGLRSKGSRKGS